MFTTRKKIDSKSLWLLAACILPLYLATPARCDTASSADLAAQTNHQLLASASLIDDLPDIFIPKPPPPPPPADLASAGLIDDLPDIFIPKPPPPPPPAERV